MSRGRGPWGRGHPPWWPEDEAWPPSGSDWRLLRQRFIVRAALFAIVGFVLLVLATGLVFRLLFAPHDTQGWHGPPIFGFVFLLVLGGALFLRVFRSTAAPLGEIMDATGRLATGDYSVRVTPRGPRDFRSLAGAFNGMAERLQANEQRRRDLLADIAHELRTPLSIIRGNAEGLLDGVYAPDAAHAGLIIEEAEVMARLLSDLSTLSKAEAGQLALQLETVDPADLAREAIEAFRARAETQSVELSLDAGGALQAIEVDRVRIHEVLSNLVTNALNYTPAGGRIVVRVASDGDGKVRFAVTDTGEGISPEALPHIFDRFSRSPGSRGSGLGLAIARSLVLAHGGEITAESSLNQGTMVSFTLDAKAR